MSEKQPSLNQRETKPKEGAPKTKRSMFEFTAEAETIAAGAEQAATFSTPEIARLSPEACAEKIIELEALYEHFEHTHTLDVLRSISHFTSKAERDSSPRHAAHAALTPIIEILNLLKTQTAISKEAYDGLKARSWVLENAVGFIQGDPSGEFYDIVIHDRVHKY